MNVVASREFWSIDELHTLLGLGKAEGSIDASNNGVRITDVALVATATYSNRYITDRFLLGKTIDLADEAISALRLQQDTKPTQSVSSIARSQRYKWNSSCFEKR
jgi:ATP-dependent Clp protease ATP-binding subunit ClpA